LRISWRTERSLESGDTDGVAEEFFRFRDTEHGFDTGIAGAEETHRNTSLPRRSNNDLWDHFLLRGSNNKGISLFLFFAFCLFSDNLKGFSRSEARIWQQRGRT